MKTDTWYGKIPDTWQVLTVEELVKDNILFPPKDGNHGGIHPKGEDFVEDGIPFVMASDLVNGEVDYKNCKKITKKQAESLQKGFAIDGDILLSHKATIGRTAVVKTDLEYILLTPQVTYYRIKDPTKLTRLYLYCLFNSPRYQEILKVLAGGGSTRSYIGITAQGKVPILMPSVEEQRFIEAIYWCLDRKIENLRKQNETLEQIAQTLFQHWFVDFEFPYDFAQGRPSADGKPYKSSGGEMVPSELGEIPAGWRVEPLDNVAEFLNGLALQKYPATDDDDFLPVIKIREMKSGVTGNTDRASSNVPSQYIIDNGDVLFSWSGSLEIVIWCFGKGALNQHLFKVSSTRFPKWFYYLWTLEHLTHFRAIAKSKATTMGHIQRKHLSEALCYIPTEDQFQFMDAVMCPVLDKAIQNSLQIQTLTQTRDTLLPKLMSGKLRIKP